MKIPQEINNSNIHTKESKNSNTVNPKLDQYIKGPSVAATLGKGLYTDMAYGRKASKPKSLEELMDSATATDVAANTDAMVVMSHTMSNEDYKKACEEGFDPGKVSATESVDILDHIKVALAESGTIVPGYNDDMSRDVMEEISGSAAAAGSLESRLKESDLPASKSNINAIEEATGLLSDIENLTEGAYAYMVENNLEPTIQNIYTASFSAPAEAKAGKGYYAQETEGYMAKRAEEIDRASMEPQVEKAVEAMDLKDISLEDAKELGLWLVEKGIPLSQENIVSLHNAKSVEFPLSKEYVEARAISALGEGRLPKDTNLSPYYRTPYRQAKDFIGRLENTIYREETRLKMTLEAAVSMARKGFDLDTKDLAGLIDELRAERNRLSNLIYGEDNTFKLGEKIDIFTTTNRIMEDMPTLPVAMIGRLALNNQENTTLPHIHELGKSIESTLKQAGSSYEKMLTEVRRDLGDSIHKAFRNVDNILEDLKLPLNEANRRAVRILGYNGIVINNEEIEKVREMDGKLTALMEELTPPKTLSLIRQGINPLGLSLDELTDKLRALDTAPGEDNERFSKFLYKLEKSNDITPEERESYIGVYKLLYKLEKTDHASLGSIMERGGEVTFESLISDLKSRKQTVDAKINDNFGFLKETVSKAPSLITQIEAAFRAQIGDKSNKSLEEQYRESKAEQARAQSRITNKEIIANLVALGIEVTADNIEAAYEYSLHPGELFENIKNLIRKGAEKEKETEILKKAQNFLDGLGESDREKEEKKSAEKYEDLCKSLREALDTASISANKSIDLMSISLMHKQVSLAVSEAKEENYHIPVLIGNSLTDINLRIVRGKDRGLVEINMNTEEYGSVLSQFHLDKEKVKGLILLAENKGLEAMRRIREGFGQALAKEGFELSDYSTIRSESEIGNKYYGTNADNKIEGVDTASLYKVAKIFIKSIERENNL